MTVAMSQLWVRRNKTLRAGSSKGTKEVKQISTYSVAQATLFTFTFLFHIVSVRPRDAIHVLGTLQVYIKINK